MKNVLGNWTIAGTYTYQSPEFATLQTGVDSNLNNDNSGDRTIINPAGAADAGSGVLPYNAKGQVSGTAAKPGVDTVAFVAINSNARYVQAGVGALANGGRNTFPLKPTDNIDLSLIKSFNITERLRFELAGQFFNVFNHAQYTGGFLSDVAGSSQINSRNELIPSSPQFGRFDQFYIAAKIIF